MNTLLVLAVGGSNPPVIRAIQDHSPDRVYFMVSVDAAGHPGSRKNLPEIIAATFLDDRYEVLEVGPDDLNDCFTKSHQLLARLRASHPQARVIVDYTGGTKTMSGALLLAAVEQGGCDLSLVSGERTNLVQVADGTETAVAVNSQAVQVKRVLSYAESLFNGFAYRSAQTTLEEFVRRTPLVVEARNDILQRVSLCRGFDAWDRFAHLQAEQLLKPFAKNLGSYWQMLLRLNQRQKHSGFEPVFDLILNAQRRAKRNRYDDAVARLYRAVEMMAQIQLQQSYKLDTSRLEVSALPPGLQAIYEQRRDGEDGKIRLGLQDAYQLLKELGDPLGGAYGKMQTRLKQVLQHRNQSILAHGTTPIHDSVYSDLLTLVEALVQETGAAIKLGVRPTQFPAFHEILPQ